MTSELLTIIGVGLLLGIVAIVVSTIWPKDWVRLFVAEVAVGIGIAVLLGWFQR